MTFSQESVDEESLSFIQHLCKVIPKASNIVLSFQQIIDPKMILKVLDAALNITSVECVTLIITKVEVKEWSLDDVKSLLQLIQQRLTLLANPVQFFIKTMVKETLDTRCRQIVEALASIEHTVGVDFFLYQCTIDDDKVFESFKGLPKLREVVLFPILSPPVLINQMERMTIDNLESLNLGIMNIAIGEYRRLFGEALLSFPKLAKLQISV